MGFLISWLVSSAEGLLLPTGGRISLHRKDGKNVSATVPGEDFLSYRRHFQWMMQVTAKKIYLYVEQVLFFVFVPGKKQSISLVFEAKSTMKIFSVRRFRDKILLRL